LVDFVLKVIRVTGLTVLLFAATAGDAARAAQDDPPASTDATAERIFSTAPPKLLQIRTLVIGAGRQISTGSGFVVTGDGLAVTNYHVVSQVALEPKTYRLEYSVANGGTGDLKLLAIDLANDLAIVRLDKHDLPSFAFADAAIERDMPKGERLYSMGNPLNLGFSIVEGTYNGLVERSYNERIHFTGAINPGMSGGPTVNADGNIVGINVARNSGNQLVSFLVPARFAVALLQRVRDDETEAPDDFQAEIGRQLALWQAGLYKSIADQGFRSVTLGPYQAPETVAPWFTCWGQTNASAVPKPRASVNTTNCRSETGLFVASDFNTGVIQFSHSYLQAEDLNQFQFAAFLSGQGRPWTIGRGANRKWYTAQRCREDFIATSAPPSSPPLDVTWCAQGYREFGDLYDVSITAVTQDRGGEALVSRLSLQAVSYEAGVAFTKSFLEAVQWRK